MFGKSIVHMKHVWCYLFHSLSFALIWGEIRFWSLMRWLIFNQNKGLEDGSICGKGRKKWKKISFFSYTGWADDSLTKCAPVFQWKLLKLSFFFKCQLLLLASLTYIPLTYLGSCDTVWRINSSLIPESKLNSMRKEKRMNLLSTTISMITFLLLSKSLIKKRRECSPTIVL